MNIDKFLVVSTGSKDGKPYSFLKLIKEGKKKNTGENFAYLEPNSFMREPETLSMGQIVHYERKRVVSNGNKFVKQGE